jgi:hypothetical protein
MFKDSNIYVTGTQENRVSKTLTMFLAENPQCLISVYKDDVFFDADMSYSSASEYADENDVQSLEHSHMSPIIIDFYEGGNYQMGNVLGGYWPDYGDICPNCDSDITEETYRYIEDYYGYDAYGILVHKNNVVYHNDNASFFDEAYVYYEEIQVRCDECGSTSAYAYSTASPEQFSMDVDVEAGIYDLYVMPYNHWFQQTHSDYILIRYLP